MTSSLLCYQLSPTDVGCELISISDIYCELCEGVIQRGYEGLEAIGTIDRKINLGVAYTGQLVASQKFIHHLADNELLEGVIPHEITNASGY